MSALETDEDLPESVVQTILAPAIRHTLAHGGRVLLVPSPALGFDEVRDTVDGCVSAEQLAGKFRVVDVGRALAPVAAGSDTASLGASILAPDTVLGPNGAAGGPMDSVTAWLQENSGEDVPGLVVLYTSGLESLAAALRVTITPEVAAAVPASIHSTLCAGNVHLVVVGRPDSSLFRPMRSLAAIRIDVRTRLGRVFLYGTKPWTPGFVLAESANSGPFELLRIV
jgi:hypothetical protein